MREIDQKPRPRETPAQDSEQGYMLLGLIVAIFLITLALGVAASDMAQTVRRERERESERRAKQYVRAIRLFYLKTGHYPPSVDALKNTNMIRYLRQEYTDPLTGQGYRLIGVGQNKTTPTSFFGEPLAGIANTGLGSAAGMQSAGMPGAPGTPGTPGPGGTDTNAATGPGAPSAATPGTTGGLQTTPFTTTPFGNQIGSGATGPFMGVGTEKKGNSILVVNSQSTYDMWEFLYDPREEKLRAAAALNAGIGSVNAGSMGQGQTPGTNPAGQTPAGGSQFGFGSNQNQGTPSGPGAPGANPTGP